MQGDGVRFRLPLRDSSGLKPDSLFSRPAKLRRAASTLPMKRADSHYGRLLYMVGALWSSTKYSEAT